MRSLEDLAYCVSCGKHGNWLATQNQRVIDRQAQI